MPLKDTWKDLGDAIPGVPNSGSDISVEPINEIANAVIDVENNKADKSSLEAVSKKLDDKADVSDVYYKETIDDKLDDKANKNLSNISNEDFKSKAESAGVGGSEITVDQEYNPESENAQSGKALEQALDSGVEAAMEYTNEKIKAINEQLENVSGVANNAYTQAVANMFAIEGLNEQLGDIETLLGGI